MAVIAMILGSKEVLATNSAAAVLLQVGWQLKYRYFSLKEVAIQVLDGNMCATKTKQGFIPFF